MPESLLIEPAETATEPRILLIEDDPVDARAVQRGLRQPGSPDAALVHVTSVSDGLRRITKESFDLVLLDLSLPDCCGLTCVHTLLDACPNLPIVVLTGLDDAHTAAMAIRDGAQDYLLKGEMQPRTLHRAIRYAIERNAMRRQLAEAQRQESELKDRLLSHVSHELRTPLTAIMQFVTILQDGIAGPLVEQQAEYLAIVRRNADQLKRMIATLMDVSRASTGKLSFALERADLDTTVAAAVTALRSEAEKKQIALQFDPAGEGFEVIADVERTVEVVSNLLENAIKFTPENGRIQVAVAADRDPAFCRVTVLDTGCGIDDEHLERVFERLHQVGGGSSQSSRRGLGLGLHISREIVVRQGGRIWVESQRGRGSRFHFTLPRYSLATLLRHVAFGSNMAAPQVSVLAVRLSASAAVARAKGLDTVARYVEEVVGASIIASTDVVVPRRRPTGAQHVVFALARSKAAGAEAIALRLREAFAKSEQLTRWRIEAEVDHWTPDIQPPSENNVAAAATGLAARVEQWMETRTGGA